MSSRNIYKNAIVKDDTLKRFAILMGIKMSLPSLRDSLKEDIELS